MYIGRVTVSHTQRFPIQNASPSQCKPPKMQATHKGFLVFWEPKQMNMQRKPNKTQAPHNAGHPKCKPLTMQATQNASPSQRKPPKMQAEQKGS